MAVRALWRLVWRDVSRRPLQTVLTLIGVSVGVGAVVAIDVANASAEQAFAAGSTRLVGAATHRVGGGSGGVASSVYRTLRIEHGVRRIAPIVQGVLVDVRSGERVRLFGFDPFANLTSLRGVSGLRSGFERLVAEPNAAALGVATAARLGLRLGDEWPVRAAGRDATLRVIALVDAGDRDAELDSIALVDVGTGQRLLELGDRLSHIDLTLSDDMAARLADSLPAGVAMSPASEAAETAGQMTAAFRLNLQALSFLALLVGMFLIYSAITFSVVRRREIFGILRSLGATPRQIAWIVFAEAGLAAAAGTILGVGLGALLGQETVRLVTRTINDLYFSVAPVGASVEALTLAKAVALGLATGVAAAAVPAVEAARVPPAQLRRHGDAEDTTRARLAWASACGALFAIAGTALLWSADESLFLTFAGLFGIFAGVAFNCPLATVGMLRFVTPLVARIVPGLGAIATRTLARSISHTGVAVAALATAVSVTIGVATMVASFRSTVDHWLQWTLVADFYISSPETDGRGLSPQVADSLRGLANVAGVETYRSSVVPSPLGPVRVGATDATETRSRRLYRFAAADPKTVWERVRAGAVIVSESFATRRRLPAEGASVRLDTERGATEFPVVGIFYDYSTERGIVLFHRDVYDRHWNDRRIDSIALYVDDATQLDTTESDVRRRLAGQGLILARNADLKARALAVFDRTFAVTRALRFIAVFIAFVGIWSSLVSLHVERSRELATLRALGTTPGQLRALVTLESAILGAVAGLFSLPIGWLLAQILVHVINVRSFGWTMTLRADPAIFAQAVALSIAAALLATLYPLRRLARIPIAAALRSE